MINVKNHRIGRELFSHLKPWERIKDILLKFNRHEKELTNKKVINSIHTNHVNRSIFAIGQSVQGTQNVCKPNMYEILLWPQQKVIQMKNKKE